MRGVNKVILVGSLGRDPEVRFAANGTAIANLSIATSEQWNDKATGEKQEKTEWHRVVIFGKLAEIAQQYLTKGSQVYLEGKLQTRKWQDQNSGEDRYSTEVVLDFNGVMQMLGGGSNQNQQQSGHAPQGNNMNQQAGYNQAPAYQAPANQQARPPASRQAQAPANNQAQAGYNPNQRPQYSPNDFDEDDCPI